jgi:uncharacterized protein
MTELRPHHVVCLAAFIGRGYSSEFIEALQRLQALYLIPETRVRIVQAPDAACRACPNLTDERCALDDHAIAVLDERVRVALSLANTEYTAGELHRRLADYLTDHNLTELCGECRWRDVVDCAAVIDQRLNELGPACVAQRPRPRFGR